MKGWTLELYKLWYKPSQAASAMVLPFQSNHHWLSAIYCALLQMSPSISCLPYLLWVPCVNNGMSRSVFFSDTENAKNVQKSKRTVFFPQKNPTPPPQKKKNPLKIVSEVFRKILITGRYWDKKKNLKSVLRAKRTKKAFLVILISHFFSLEMKAVKEWGAELLTIFTLSSGSQEGAAVEAEQKMNRYWKTAYYSRKENWIKLKFCRNFYYSDRT